MVAQHLAELTAFPEPQAGNGWRMNWTDVDGNCRNFPYIAADAQTEEKSQNERQKARTLKNLTPDL